MPRYIQLELSERAVKLIKTILTEVVQDDLLPLEPKLKSMTNTIIEVLDMKLGNGVPEEDDGYRFGAQHSDQE